MYVYDVRLRVYLCYYLKCRRLANLTPPEVLLCSICNVIVMHHGNVNRVNFDQPNMWLPNSPDPNPVDYVVWGALQEMVYHCKSFYQVCARTKKCNRHCMTTLVTAFLDVNIGEWPRRLENLEIKYVCSTGLTRYQR